MQNKEISVIKLIALGSAMALCVGFAFNAVIKTDAKSNNLSVGIELQCATHPIRWYALDIKTHYKEKHMYKFGEKDVDFRAEVAKLLQIYVDTGKDFDQKPVVDKYLPNYIPACMESYKPFIKDCGQYVNDSDTTKFKTCAEPYDNDYKETIAAFMREESNLHNIVDWENFTFEYAQKLKRKAQLEPFMSESKQN